MKRPTYLARRIGSKGFCALAASAAAVVVGGWLSGELPVPWPIPLALIGLTLNALKTRREVEAFDAWQRDWNMLAGDPQPELVSVSTSAFASATAAAPARRKRYGAVALWSFTLVLLIGNHQPFTVEALGSPDGIAFLIASSWLVGSRLFNGLRPTGNGRATSVAKGRSAPTLHIVQTCLPVPRRSPGIEQVMAGLPQYCRALLKVAP